MSPLSTTMALAVPTLVLDQLAKQAVLQILDDHATRRIAVVPGVFNIVEVWNKGVSFGLLGNLGLPSWVLTALSLVICVGLLAWVWRGLPAFPAAGVGLVIGGAIGNVIDRVRWGGVFDFADFYVGKWHWPAFNVADSAIVIGVAVLLLDSIFRPGRRTA